MDPETGRFISEDPIADYNNPNLYSYCRNNPLVITDPTGLETKTQTDLQTEYDDLSDEEKMRESTAYKVFSFLGLDKVAEFLGIDKTYTVSFSQWTSEQGYSSVTGSNDVRYYYQNSSWANGGDVITQDGVSYIHHDDSYTLIDLGSGNTHSFNSSFDPNSRLESTLMNPEFVRAVREVIFRFHISDRDHSVRIGEGYREWATQERYYAQGRTTPGDIITNAQPGWSWHQYGLAVDMNVQNGGSQQALARVAQSVGLEWGGNFTTIYDPPHFQMTGGFTSVRQALTIRNNYIRQGYTEAQALRMVWDAM